MTTTVFRAELQAFRVDVAEDGAVIGLRLEGTRGVTLEFRMRPHDAEKLFGSLGGQIAVAKARAGSLV